MQAWHRALVGFKSVLVLYYTIFLFYTEINSVTLSTADLFNLGGYANCKIKVKRS